MTKTFNKVQLEQFGMSMVINGGDRIQAYRSAGGRATDAAAQQAAARWLKLPIVQKAMETTAKRLADQTIAKASISVNWVDQGIIDTVEECARKGDAQGRLRGLELAGKRLGLYTDKQLVGDVDRDLAGMTPEQIEARAKALVAEIGVNTFKRYLSEMEPNVEPVEPGGSGPDAVGPEAPEAGALPPVPEAGGLSPGRVLQ